MWKPHLNLSTTLPLESHSFLHFFLFATLLCCMLSTILSTLLAVFCFHFCKFVFFFVWAQRLLLCKVAMRKQYTNKTKLNEKKSRKNRINCNDIQANVPTTKIYSLMFTDTRIYYMENSKILEAKRNYSSNKQAKQIGWLAGCT